MSKQPVPWERLSSEKLVDDPPWMRLRRDVVRLPSGRTLDRYWIVEQSPWVNVVAVTARDEAVLVRQYRHALGRVILEIPGGYAPDEEPLSAARRELSEETGYGGGDWSLLMKTAPNPALQNNWLHCFLATGVEVIGTPALEETEDIVVELVRLSTIPDLIANGEICNALHVLPLLVYLTRILE